MDQNILISKGIVIDSGKYNELMLNNEEYSKLMKKL